METNEYNQKQLIDKDGKCNACCVDECRSINCELYEKCEKYKTLVYISNIKTTELIDWIRIAEDDEHKLLLRELLIEREPFRHIWSEITNLKLQKTQKR